MIPRTTMLNGKEVLVQADQVVLNVEYLVSQGIFSIADGGLRVAETAEMYRLISMAILARNIKRDTDHIKIIVNSTGGPIDNGLQLYDQMIMSRIPITTICYRAYSMGAWLFLAGEYRYMMPHGRIMIHDPQGVIQGTHRQSLSQAQEFEARTLRMIELMQGRGVTLGVRELEIMMEKETYLTAEEAIDHGFAHGIVTPEILYG